MHKVALLIVVVAACKKSETTAPASGSGTPPTAGSGSAVTADTAGSAGSGSDSGSGSAGVGSAGAGSAGSAAGDGKIECKEAISQSVADTHFKGVEQEHVEPTGPYSDRASTTCRFMYDKKTNKKILVEYECGGEMTSLDTYLAGQQKLFPRTKLKRVPEIGGGAYLMGEGTYGVHHRSLPCIIMLDLAFLDEKDALRKKDYFPLLRDLEAALPDAP